MKILLNAWPNFIQNHVGDYYANSEIEALSYQYSDMSFEKVFSRKAILFANLRSVLLNVATRSKLFEKNFKLLQPLFNLQCSSYLPQDYIDKTLPDVIYAHSHIPRYGNHSKVPLVAVEYLSSDHYMRMTNTYATRERDIEAKRCAIERASVILTTTPGSFSRMQQLIPSVKKRLIHAPIYMPYLEPVSKELIAAKLKSSQKIKVLFVGGEAKRKGLHNVVRAFSKIPDSILKKVEFDVVSKFLDGPVPGLEKIANVRHGITSVELSKLFSEADIFLFPTRFDTYGRVIVEAMANGCAIITSNQDPQDWILNYGDAGILVDPESPAQIAAEMARLVNSASLRAKYSLAAHTRFLEVFYHKVVGAIYRSAFDFAIKNK